MADRVLIVHTLEQATALLALNRPVMLQSAPDAIFYAGALYLLSMFREAQKQYPGSDAVFILDCADAGAETIDAIQMGHTHIRSSAPEPLLAKLADIAKQANVIFLDGAYESLDVRHEHDIKAAALTFLTGTAA